MAPCAVACAPPPRAVGGTVGGTVGWNRGWNRSLLATAQVMGSLACDEGEAATPAPGAAKRDALEPSLRARFKDMQKIGEGTYGVARQRSKKWEAWRGEWHRGFWRLVAVLGR